jgi:hypothetical protein
VLVRVGRFESSGGERAEALTGEEPKKGLGKVFKAGDNIIARLQLACGEPAGEGATGRLQFDRHDASEGCRRRARHRPSETVSARGLRQR